MLSGPSQQTNLRRISISFEATLGQGRTYSDYQDVYQREDLNKNKTMCKQRKKVIYFLGGIDRIGQLVSEIFFLRNLFDNDKHDFVVLTYPPEDNPRVNRACYDFVMRGMKILLQNKQEFRWSTTKGIQDIDGDIYFFRGALDLQFNFSKKFLREKPNFYFSLTDKDIERSNQLRNLFGIPLDAPIVTLHNRESGYLKEQDREGIHSYRNADIDNYIQAIKYLASKGYYVVRLGDKSMKPLPPISNKVIDAPFHQYYSQYVELYFTALSKFMICLPGGPIALALGFNVPLLWVNTPIQSHFWGNEHDLIVPKKYYSRIVKRYLTYSEIITSPLPDFHYAKNYEEFGVELHENSSEEILRATKEMEARLEGQYSSKEDRDAVNRRVKRIELKGDRYRRHTCHDLAFYFLYWSKMRISHEFIEMNPYFLEEKQWEPEAEATSSEEAVADRWCGANDRSFEKSDAVGLGLDSQ